MVPWLVLGLFADVTSFYHINLLFHISEHQWVGNGANTWACGLCCPENKDFCSWVSNAVSPKVTMEQVKYVTDVSHFRLVKYICEFNIKCDSILPIKSINGWYISIAYKYSQIPLIVLLQLLVCSPSNTIISPSPRLG